MDDWIRVRGQFGFDASPARVSELAGSRGPSIALGAPLSVDEEADLKERQAREAAVPAFAARLAAVQPNNGGVYIDQRRRGIVVALVTTPLSEAMETQLRSSSAFPTHLEFKQVRFSEKELNSSYEKIVSALSSAQFKANRIVDTYVDVVANRVHVGALDVTAATPYFSASYTSPIYTLEQTLPPVREDTTGDSPGPIKAGLGIRELGQGVDSCTTAFPVADLARGGQAVLLAGHCVDPTKRSWSHGGAYLGDWEQSTWVDGTTNVDVAFIRIAPGMRSNVQWLGSNYLRETRAVQGFNADVVGSMVCKHGMSTGYTCGQIVSRSGSKQDAGITLTEQRLADYSSAPGDSGSGVYNGGQGDVAVGVHSGRIGSYANYSHIANIQNRLGVAVYTNPIVYKLHAEHSGQCMDVPGSSLQAGVQLIQYPCFGTLNQQWNMIPYAGTQYYMFRTLLSSAYCVDVEGSSPNSGARVLQWPCHGGNNQRWDLQRVPGTNRFSVSPVHTFNECLDVTGYSQTPAAPLQQYQCFGTTNQQWYTE